MSRRPLALTALIGVSLCAPVVARGSVVTPLDTRALVRLSPIIVRGEVETVLAGPNGSGTIDTWVSVSVEESLRGAEGRSHVVLRLPGGIWGDRVSLVHGTPTFRVGERVVVFATPTRSGDLTVAGLFQGKFRIEGTAGEEAALPDPGTGALLVVGPRGAGPAVREPLDHFLTHVRELVRFEPTRDGIPVPREPALPPRAEPQPYFALLSSFIPLRWFEADSGTPVRLLLNTDGAPVSVSSGCSTT